MSQPIKVVVVVVVIVVFVKIRSIIAETTLSSIVSQPITVDVFVFVVDAEAVVVVVVDDFVVVVVGGVAAADFVVDFVAVVVLVVAFVAVVVVVDAVSYLGEKLISTSSSMCKVAFCPSYLLC